MGQAADSNNRIQHRTFPHYVSGDNKGLRRGRDTDTFWYCSGTTAGPLSVPVNCRRIEIQPLNNHAAKSSNSVPADNGCAANPPHGVCTPCQGRGWTTLRCCIAGWHLDKGGVPGRCRACMWCTAGRAICIWGKKRDEQRVKEWAPRVPRPPSRSSVWPPITEPWARRPRPPPFSVRRAAFLSSTLLWRVWQLLPGKVIHSAHLSVTCAAPAPTLTHLNRQARWRKQSDNVTPPPLEFHATRMPEDASFLARSDVSEIQWHQLSVSAAIFFRFFHTRWAEGNGSNSTQTQLRWKWLRVCSVTLYCKSCGGAFKEHVWKNNSCFTRLKIPQFYARELTILVSDFVPLHSRSFLVLTVTFSHSQWQSFIIYIINLIIICVGLCVSIYIYTHTHTNCCRISIYSLIMWK